MESESTSPALRTRLSLYMGTMRLAYRSFGVVYGELSISPIYVYKSTFSGSLRLYEEDHEILGVLSLVFWTLTIIPLCKYIIFVLGADDNGEGGTFALYSLLCRHSKMGLLDSYHVSAVNIPSYQSETSTMDTRTSLIIKGFFEKHRNSRIVLLLVVLLGTGMIIGDGILTPTMSVLSAVSGIKIKVPELHDGYTTLIACTIMVVLFGLQHYGTHRIGFLFAPILIAWLLCISMIGIFNIFYWNPRVIRALSPYYIYNFFQKAGTDGWSSLGGIVLCLTGAEAMFADLGHFSQTSIRIAFTGVVYPCLVLAYMGEAAYLTKHRMDLHSSFYKAIPEVIFWPVFVIATLATVVGSQAIISATFSIISQCRALSCFPRVKIIHTSNEIHGQIYIPEVNWMLMITCLSVVIGFRDTKMIGNAYGLAVITVMFITTCLMFLIICTVWKKHVLMALGFVLAFGSVELLYFSACLAKVHHGGWLPLLFSLAILSSMSIWQYGTSRKHAFEQENKVCLERLLRLGPSLGIRRVPGIGLIYSNVASGVPPMFAHFVTNFPAYHQILIFATFQSIMLPKVEAADRFLISRIGTPEYHLFQCIVRYGYKDPIDSYNLETQLIEQVGEFLKKESGSNENGKGRRRKVAFKGLEWSDEVKELMEAREAGVAYMMSNTYVVAAETSSVFKKFAIDVVYGFLRRNSRRPLTTLRIPHTSLIEVGMIYHV